MKRFLSLSIIFFILSCQNDKRNNQSYLPIKEDKIATKKTKMRRKPILLEKKEKIYNRIKSIAKRYHNGITFSICDADTANKLFEDIPYKEALERMAQKKIEGYSFKKAYSQKLIPQGNFITTLQTAYSQHYPITISPDMVWLLICQGFSTHVSMHSETLRSKIVNHQGKKDIEVTNDFIKNGYNNWAVVFPMFTDSVKNYIQDNVYELMIPEFSTTTPDIKIAYQVTLMETVEKYFDFGMFGCGIPFITLEGNSNDWRKIRKKVKELRKYNLSHWVDNLIPILDQFVYASEGKINAEFWESIIKYKFDYEDTYINGWIIKFFPYLRKKVSANTGVQTTMLSPNPYLYEVDFHKARLIPRDFPEGIAKIDFTWIDGNLGKYSMEFRAGFMGMTQNKKTKALRPEIAWIVVDKKNNF